MNKNGFTLTELLASIALLSIISIVTATLVVHFLKKGNEDLYQQQLNNIKLAAKAWVSDNKDEIGECYTLTLEELIDNNYIDDNVKDVRDNKTLDKTKVKVKVIKEGKTYKYEVNPTEICYTIGTKVTINNDEYYIIEDSPSDQDYVILLKDKPLTVEEVERYGEGHINQYLYNEYYQTPYSFRDVNNTAGVAYSTSETILYSWAQDVFDNNQLKVRYNEYGGKVENPRLISLDTLQKFGYYYVPETFKPGDSTPNWLYNNDYSYWTLEEKYSYLYVVMNNGTLNQSRPDDTHFAIRPVVEIKKSALEGGNDNE